MRFHFLVCFLVLTAQGGTVSAQPTPQAPTPQAIVPESLQWRSPPGNPLLKSAWVVGGEKATGAYALRVTLLKGGRIPVHTHPDARHSTVLSGTLFVGFGEIEDHSKLVAIPAGGVYVAPAGVAHYLYARDTDVVYQESGFGPTATVFVD